MQPCQRRLHRHQPGGAWSARACLRRRCCRCCGRMRRSCCVAGQLPADVALGSSSSRQPGRGLLAQHAGVAATGAPQPRGAEARARRSRDRLQARCWAAPLSSTPMRQTMAEALAESERQRPFGLRLPPARPPADPRPCVPGAGPAHRAAGWRHPLSGRGGRRLLRLRPQPRRLVRPARARRCLYNCRVVALEASGDRIARHPHPIRIASPPTPTCSPPRGGRRA